MLSLSSPSQGLLEPIPVISMGEGRVNSGWVASSSQGPYWWQRLLHKVPTAHQEQYWGPVSCSRILQHIAQFCPRGAGIRNSDLAIISRPVFMQKSQRFNNFSFLNIRIGLSLWTVGRTKETSRRCHFGVSFAIFSTFCRPNDKSINRDNHFQINH